MNEIRTGLFHIFVYDHKIGKPPPCRPFRYFPHLESPRFRPSVELRAGEDPDEFIAKLIRRARRFGRRRDKYLWWDRRVVGGGKVRRKRVGRYVGSGLRGGLLLWLCSSGSRRGGIRRQERGIKLARVFECARNIIRQSFLCVSIVESVRGTQKLAAHTNLLRFGIVRLALRICKPALEFGLALFLL